MKRRGKRKNDGAEMASNSLAKSLNNKKKKKTNENKYKESILRDYTILRDVYNLNTRIYRNGRWIKVSVPKLESTTLQEWRDSIDLVVRDSTLHYAALRLHPSFSSPDNFEEHMEALSKRTGDVETTTMLRNVVRDDLYAWCNNWHDRKKRMIFFPSKYNILLRQLQCIQEECPNLFEMCICEYDSFDDLPLFEEFKRFATTRAQFFPPTYKYGDDHYIITVGVDKTKHPALCRTYAVVYPCVSFVEPYVTECVNIFKKNRDRISYYMMSSLTEEHLEMFGNAYVLVQRRTYNDAKPVLIEIIKKCNVDSIVKFIRPFLNNNVIQLIKEYINIPKMNVLIQKIPLSRRIVNHIEQREFNQWRQMVTLNDFELYANVLSVRKLLCEHICEHSDMYLHNPGAFSRYISKYMEICEHNEAALNELLIEFHDYVANGCNVDHVMIECICEFIMKYSGGTLSETMFQKFINTSLDYLPREFIKEMVSKRIITDLSYLIEHATMPYEVAEVLCDLIPLMELKNKYGDALMNRLLECSDTRKPDTMSAKLFTFMHQYADYHKNLEFVLKSYIKPQPSSWSALMYGIINECKQLQAAPPHPITECCIIKRWLHDDHENDDIVTCIKVLLDNDVGHECDLVLNELLCAVKSSNDIVGVLKLLEERFYTTFHINSKKHRILQEYLRLIIRRLSNNNLGDDIQQRYEDLWRHMYPRTSFECRMIEDLMGDHGDEIDLEMKTMETLGKIRAKLARHRYNISSSISDTKCNNNDNKNNDDDDNDNEAIYMKKLSKRIIDNIELMVAASEEEARTTIMETLEKENHLEETRHAITCPKCEHLLIVPTNLQLINCGSCLNTLQLSQ